MKVNRGPKKKKKKIDIETPTVANVFHLFVAHFRAPNKKVNQPCPTHVTQISLLWTHFEHHFWHGKHHQIRFNEGAPFTNKLWQIMRPKIKFDSYVNPRQQEAAA